MHAESIKAIDKQILGVIYSHFLCIQATLFNSIYIDLSAWFPPFPLDLFEPLTLILSFEAVRMTKVMPLGCCLESWGDSVSFPFKSPGIFKCVTDIPAPFSFKSSPKKKKKGS